VANDRPVDTAERMKPLLPVLLPYSIAAMILALTLYSIGVWGEKLVGRLQPWQLYFFWLGFACDTAGTTLMGRIAGRFDLDVHGLTGLAAILLMALHAIWASVALALKQERVITYFHRFSVAVWTLWLIPFFSGVFLAMRH
jgi:uncharacterized repeat protein (TIGR03987 family)